MALVWIGLAAIVYQFLLRRPILNWGATNAEAHARLPGDELLEDADGVATRAITIDAPASAVWPWIAQIGPSPRGGAYTYDWIENLLGLDMHSSDRVLPEYQHPQVGDTLGYGKNRMRFERVEPERVLATRSEDGNWVWSFVLDERNERTRLISRNRFRLPSMTARIGMVPMEPGSLIMERKMLRGIKQRAEHLAPRERRQHMSEPRSEFTTDEARHFGEQIGIDWAASPFDVEQFRIGMNIELEHGLQDMFTNVSDDDPQITAKIALAHLNEFPDYYTRLERMEEEAKRDQARRTGNSPSDVS